jgi:hypothetical protein
MVHLAVGKGLQVAPMTDDTVAAGCALYCTRSASPKSLHPGRAQSRERESVCADSLRLAAAPFVADGVE